MLYRNERENRKEAWKVGRGSRGRRRHRREEKAEEEEQVVEKKWEGNKEDEEEMEEEEEEEDTIPIYGFHVLPALLVTKHSCVGLFLFGVEKIHRLDLCARVPQCDAHLKKSKIKPGFKTKIKIKQNKNTIL